jgi:hypothetical protein
MDYVHLIRPCYCAETDDHDRRVAHDIINSGVDRVLLSLVAILSMVYQGEDSGEKDRSQPEKIRSQMAPSVVKACYKQVRAQFGLAAQMTIRALAKVGNAYKLDKQAKRTFRPLASIAYDDRILSFALPKFAVSLWTLEGRQSLPFVCGERQRQLLQTRHGASDLVLHGGE